MVAKPLCPLYKNIIKPLDRARYPELRYKLAEMGWHTIGVWECELKPAVREQTLESLAFTLNHIFLQDRSIRRYEQPEEDSVMVAEPDDFINFK